MLIIIILLLLGLCGFCVLASDDLLNKTNTTFASWIIVITMFLAIIGCLFIVKDEVERQTVIKYHLGKYKMEVITHTDTTYFVKKIK